MKEYRDRTDGKGQEGQKMTARIGLGRQESWRKECWDMTARTGDSGQVRVGKREQNGQNMTA
jgi:hypothetical protein